jgi:hypothetical protein
VEVAGVEAAEWVRMYIHTHKSGTRLEWPDGGSYLGQLALVIEVWEILEDEISLKNGAKR